MFTRTPVGMAEHQKLLFVICDDGSIWQFDPKAAPKESWKKWRWSMPGTPEREKEEKNRANG